MNTPFLRPVPSLVLSAARLMQMVAVVLLVNAVAVSAALSEPPKSAEAARPLRLVALGDSLTAGLGLAQSDAFPAQLERSLRSKGYRVDVANAGVSGDTSGGGLQRLDWAVPQGTDAVIVELGANDALRGIDPALTRQALDKILTRLAARGIPALVAGMKAPANWGPDYVTKFDPLFAELAAKHGAMLYPFFLDGVVGRVDLNQGDGLHPTAAGIAEIVARILPSVEKLLAVAQDRVAKASASKS